MDDRQRLASLVRYSGPVLTRYVAGFTDHSRTRQAPGLPNHVAWTLGHCAYTMGRLVERLGGPALPDADFVDMGGRGAGAQRFDYMLVRKGSSPVDNGSMNPTLARCHAIFDEGIERLAQAAQECPDLDREVDWGGTAHRLGDLVMRVSLHNATHAGELADLRRALGMPSITG